MERDIAFALGKIMGVHLSAIPVDSDIIKYLPSMIWFYATINGHEAGHWGYAVGKERKLPDCDGIRRCNVYGCGAEMRPTRRLDDFPLHNEAYRLRYWRCTVCDNETPWLKDPDPTNTSYGRLHYLNESTGGGHSGASMMSDPLFYPPIMIRPTRPRRG